jgi:hypothetical protein
LDVTMTTDPAATAARLAELDAYYSRVVLSGAGEFVCPAAVSCETSALRHADVGFYEAQGSAVSPHYDVRDGGVPLRVLVVPMETGLPRSRVTIEERTAEVLALTEKPWRQWNSHMRGVGLALRLAFGAPLGDDDEGVLLATPDGTVHMLTAYAMANLLLCSAVTVGTKASRSTPTMRRNA